MARFTLAAVALAVALFAVTAHASTTWQVYTIYESSKDCSGTAAGYYTVQTGATTCTPSTTCIDVSEQVGYTASGTLSCTTDLTNAFPSGTYVATVSYNSTTGCQSATAYSAVYFTSGQCFIETPSSSIEFACAGSTVSVTECNSNNCQGSCQSASGKSPGCTVLGNGLGSVFVGCYSGTGVPPNAASGNVVSIVILVVAIVAAFAMMVVAV